MDDGPDVGEAEHWRLSVVHRSDDTGLDEARSLFEVAAEADRDQQLRRYGTAVQADRTITRKVTTLTNAACRSHRGAGGLCEGAGLRDVLAREFGAEAHDDVGLVEVTCGRASALDDPARRARQVGQIEPLDLWLDVARVEWREHSRP